MTQPFTNFTNRYCRCGADLLPARYFSSGHLKYRQCDAALLEKHAIAAFRSDGRIVIFDSWCQDCKAPTDAQPDGCHGIWNPATDGLLREIWHRDGSETREPVLDRLAT